jgi:hypothetical protein
MKLQLLVSKWCPTCPAAERVWSEAAAREGLKLEVLDVADSLGRSVAVDLNPHRSSNGDRRKASGIGHVHNQPGRRAASAGSQSELASPIFVIFRAREAGWPSALLAAEWFCFDYLVVANVERGSATLPILRTRRPEPGFRGTRKLL